MLETCFIQKMIYFVEILLFLIREKESFYCYTCFVAIKAPSEKIKQPFFSLIFLKES